MADPVKYVYDFADGDRGMVALLGGKGANLAEMVGVLGEDRVPPGFTITTEACVAWMRLGREPDGLERQVPEAIARLEQRAGRKLGDPDDPLLISARSGARESMPGMLDTVLNLGINDRTVGGLARRSGSERFAWDSRRRFAQMFGNVVAGIPGELYENELGAVKSSAGVEFDNELGVAELRRLVEAFEALYREQTGTPLPSDPVEQLEMTIRAVFDSWKGPRAVEYRRINGIPDDWGTAVNVQQMVFGNLGSDSGSGVAFSRDEMTGAPKPSGDFLFDAQGEDVVSGVRNTLDLDQLAEPLPEVHRDLLGILATLEAHFGDMQDVEFTIEEGRLYILQTRAAKRPARAAVRFAVDAVSEGLLRRPQALTTIEAAKLDQLLHPSFDPDHPFGALARGVAASPGAAKGEAVFSAEAAVEAAHEGRDVILVRRFTEADDVAGFNAARGILTSEGGKASHAALVARGMGRPCVSGAAEVEVDAKKRLMRVGDTVIREGELIAIDGSTGEITNEDVPLVEAVIDEYFETVLEWADEIRHLEVRANADTPDDAARSRSLGAEGVGLCRTEHMFMSADRLPKVRAVIVSAEEQDRRRRLEALLPLQQGDFEGILREMEGLPVTVRLLDPPLHEFLPPSRSLEAELERVRGEDPDRVEETERMIERVERLSEVNPMLGTRGCRLGILYPEIYEMQVRAMMRAARAVTDSKAERPKLEVMIPLVNYERELEIIRDRVVSVAHEEGMEVGKDFRVGTMVELPRACMAAGLIAAQADFFSFGTNDLTQSALGLSRDDAEGHILSVYLDQRIVDRSPFESLDAPGVGALIEMAVARGRAVRPDLKLGVCGEHGGDPDSIEFFNQIGLDYVSCSPFRVPVARLAAANAVTRAEAAAAMTPWAADAGAHTPA
ncbi:MAG: pyruvate, phosphate dikinase [Solirubrobacterales bacterium]|nr:pyruvate, phosphate dikinase [Solirubrobacterales bacterium]